MRLTLYKVPDGECAPKLGERVPGARWASLKIDRMGGPNTLGGDLVYRDAPYTWIVSLLVVDADNSHQTSEQFAAYCDYDPTEAIMNGTIETAPKEPVTA